MGHGKFGTVINCIDGRAQNPATDWLKDNLSLDYVDVVTEPGPDRRFRDEKTQDILKEKVLISVNAHHSNVIAFAAHHDCAGNPVTEEEHKEQIKECTKIVESWGLEVRVLGFWVNDQWQIEIVYDSESN